MVMITRKSIDYIQKDCLVSIRKLIDMCWSVVAGFVGGDWFQANYTLTCSHNAKLSKTEACSCHALESDANAV